MVFSLTIIKLKFHLHQNIASWASVIIKSSNVAY